MPITDTIIQDEISGRETLYRSVWQQTQCLSKDSEGKLHVSTAAFDDNGNEVSLFRKALCDAPPYSSPPRMRGTDFVVSLLAHRIREGKISVGDKGETLTIDVKPDLTDGQHKAHAVVYPNRTIGKKVFRKVRKRLTEIVEEDWPIKPDPDFIAALPIQSEDLG